MRILIAEDEHSLNEIIAKKLISDGYSVDCCHDGEEATSVLSYADYDAIILDIMMSKTDGFVMLCLFREAGKTTPALSLTAKDAVSGQVKGLDSDANDYLVKPFVFEELSARLHAITRVPFGMAKNVIAVAGPTLDCNGQTIKHTNRDTSLSGEEYVLLEYPIRNSELVLSREEIEDHAQNSDYEGGTNAVDVYISYLRHKVDDGFDKRLTHTVRDRGYVLAEDRPA